jgi:uncharacterized protein with ATP-grasp and redox domains
METHLECIPCLIRHTLETVRRITDDEAVQEKVLRAVLRDTSEMDLSMPPPMMAQAAYRLMRRLSGMEDPYKESKERFNLRALEFYPRFKSLCERSADPMETAVRLAIAGNIIDLGPSNLEDSQVIAAIEDSLKAPLQGSDFEEFRKSVNTAKRILYLGDNAGEIVFDRLLIEHMPYENVTFVVRGAPVINDVTMADAQYTGLTDLVEVIDNGSDAPGTIVEECSDAFQIRLNDADLIVAKGQGNFETLNAPDKIVYFLLTAKCLVVSRHMGCEIGSLILFRPKNGDNTS